MSNNHAYPLWDEKSPLPTPGMIPDLRHATHAIVHRAIPGEFQFLHESAIAFHKNELIVAWANDPVDENSPEGVVRARRSTDRGLTWSAPEMVAPGSASPAGRECDNHVVLHSHGDRLYAYASRWLGGSGEDHSWHPLPSMRAVQFLYDAQTGNWNETGVEIPEFLLMQGPQKLPGGGWIMTGEFGFYQPAVAICPDDDMTAWQTVPITTVRKLRFPEPTVIVEPDRLVAIVRNAFMLGPPQEFALVSESFDGGRSWSEARLSNLPMADSKPFGGILSTGQRYLICNYPNPHCRRGNLVIAVSEPDGDRFVRMRTIRQGVPPVQMKGECKESQWSYAYAVEHEDELYVSYSISKEDCAMSVIPLSALTVDTM